MLVTDRDLPVAEHMLEHQLRRLAHLCAEVIVSVNRFPTPTAPVGPMNSLLNALSEQFPTMRAVEIDGSEEARRCVSDAFFDGQPYPLFDFKGTPIHALLIQILRATQPHYLHLESDMLLGGDIEQWLPAAVEAIDDDGRLIAINPLGGPPRADGVYSTPSASLQRYGGHDGFVVTTMNTRVFLIDREAFVRRLSPIAVHGPRDIRTRFNSIVRGARGADLLERLMTERMAQRSLLRFDLGGPSESPAWTLHPLYKTPTYVAALSDVIDRVERNDVPDGQRGEFDVHPSMVDLPDIPSTATRARRLLVAGAHNWPERLRGELSHSR